MERYIGSGQTLYSLFYPASVSDPNPLTDTETVNVALNETGDASLTKGNPGSISDPPNLTSATFSESGLIAGTPPFAQNLLDRLYYNAPALSNGQSDQVLANVTMSVAASPGEPSPSAPSLSPSSVTIDVVTPPLISGTVANQPVAAGGTIKPFRRSASPIMTSIKRPRIRRRSLFPTAYILHPPTRTACSRDRG
jgi:hypothetical protein